MPIIFVCTVCVCLFRLHMAYMCVWQVAQAETANKRCDLVFVTWLTLLCSIGVASERQFGSGIKNLMKRGVAVV